MWAFSIGIALKGGHLLEIIYAEENTAAQMVITEIYGEGPATEEWIEVKNTGGVQVELSEWKFFEAGVRHNLTPVENTGVIFPGEYAVIAQNSDTFLTKNSIGVKLFDSSWGSLSMDGEEIGLKNDEDAFVELFTYLSHTDGSLQKITPETKDYTPTNWIAGAPSPGQENFVSEIDDTPTETPATQDVNTLPSEGESTSDIDLISEENSSPSIPPSSPAPGGGGASYASPQIMLPPVARIVIQSGNTKGENKVTINVDGTSSTDPNGLALRYTWDFGDGYTYEGKNPPPHSFKEVGTYTITLVVTNTAGLRNIAFLPIEVTQAEKAETKTSTQKNKETEKNVTKQENEKEEEIEPAETNTQGEIQWYPILLLSEIMADPEGKDTKQEWIEIYNPNDVPVSTLGYKIDDITNGGSAPMKLKEMEIPAHSYLALFEFSLSINNSNEEIQLLNPNGDIIDKTSFDESITGHTFAKYDNTWQWTSTPTVQLPNVITMRIKEEDENAENVETTFLNGDLSSEIYINEFLPNPAGEDSLNEWVELYNASDRPVNLGNWRLDDNESGSKPYIIPDSIFIEAHDYLVIIRPDSKISLDNKQDTVRLFNFEEELQDEISYEKAKENMSFSKITLVKESGTEEQWQWTPLLTMENKNATLYQIQGEIENKEENIIFIKAKKLTLPETNELSELVFQPGNIIELTYDDTNAIKDYTLLSEMEIPGKIDETSFPFLRYLKWILLIVILAYIGRKKYAILHT